MTCFGTAHEFEKIFLQWGHCLSALSSPEADSEIEILCWESCDELPLYNEDDPPRFLDDEDDHCSQFSDNNLGQEIAHKTFFCKERQEEQKRQEKEKERLVV